MYVQLFTLPFCSNIYLYSVSLVDLSKGASTGAHKQLEEKWVQPEKVKIPQWGKYCV